ncbi:MAG: transcription elongation factor GreA [Phycisphaerae bacterium]|jgi:transcription elongation factor GreA|nr:transcription elongation factor GreA [Phycisphaerae bacterium]MBT6281922.1 transcription elongation factor GreA [Phycisphaerae bacterium]
MDYLTEAEHTTLSEELTRLISERLVISDRIGTARELGDLKENADYHAAKDDQAHNERKIKDLEHRLSSATVANTEHVPDGVVFLGSIVRLKNLTTEREGRYMLVGESTGSFDLDYMEVTSNSELGMSILKARVGDTVGVNLPAGRTEFEILSIED